MTDQQQRAWTPGPLNVYEVGAVLTTTYLVSPSDDERQIVARGIRNISDADLIALAPEMAEAVLEVAAEAECVPEHKRYYAENLCIAAADKLRRIGGDT